MPSNRGTFQGNLAGTGSRVLEMLTSSKAVTASYAVTASRLSVNSVGQSGQPVYFQNGVPTADTKTQNVVNWVTANSGSISGATGSSADTNIQVQELVGKSGSWESASAWVGDNSSSVSNTIIKVGNLKGISFATGVTRITASYHPTSSSQVIINIPSNPGHIGAASASHNHTFAQITNGTAISASVKRLEVSASSIKNSYVTTASFNNFTQSVANGFLPIAGGTLTGNLETKDVFINGNLTVGGTTTTIDAQNLNVKDKLILIASGSTTQAAANGAGIAVSTASAGEDGAARIQYLSLGNKFTSSVAFEAPSFTGSLKGTATNAVSASYANNASSATSASYAKNSDKTISASYASASTTASYALVAESIKDASGLTVKSADTASYVEWNNVSGHPTFVSATFQAGAFSAKTYNPVGSAQTINIPTTTDHITDLNAITQSVKQIVVKTGSWDGVASTASAAYQSASKALATASVAQREAESASYWKTEASKSAANASTYADEASGSMEDARFYRSQAATNATLSSTYAVQSSASAQLAAASASAAATSATNAANYATRAQQSASNAHTSKTLAAASASAAAASASAASSSAATAANWAVSASASANQIQADTTVAANWASSSSKYATNASASAALMYKSVGSATQPVYMTTDGPTVATAYSAASVKEAVTASRVAISAVNTNANQPLTFASGTTPSNPAVIQYDANLTYNALTNRLNVTHVNATGLTGSLRGNVVGNVTGTASFATSASRAISAESADSAITASYALIAEAVKDGAGLVVNTASYALDAAIKFDGHYAPSSSGAGTSGSSTARYYVKTIKVDGKGHVVGVTTGNETVTNTDTKVTAVGNHYTPTQSTGKAASAGSVISGLGLDAAGHVVSITGSNTIASASRAVSASRADSAASATSATSASYSSYAGNAGQLAGQAASAYALKSYTDGAYLPITGGVVTGDLTVQKNFIVAGTTSYLNTTDLIVKDKLILVSSGSTTQANSDGAGIAIQTASATTVANAEKAAARFQYRSSDNKFTASVGIVAPGFTGNLTGTASYATKAGSANSATVATGLGVAGNTSASVAAAIAAKWTYNESTIKAVKVNSASRADSAATADSATTATTSSYNKAGADALAWITANSASATTNTDRYVNTAAFASTGSNGANGVKMTLTRAGSDTAQVTAVIPVASATAAGVVTGAQLKSWTSGSGWVGANSASIATAVTNNHTHSNKAVLDGISAADTASWDGKWTYNEATIKAVKVTSASRADSAASATNATTASYITWANVSGKPSSFTPAAHNHNLLVTEGDHRATASVPNDYVNNFRFRGLKNTSTIGLTIGTGSYAYVLGLRGWSDSSGGDSHELAFNNAGIFTRHGATTSWDSWVKIITSDQTSSWATAATNSHTHSNKAVLDGITAADTASWDAKQAAISDLTTIRSNATNGNTAYSWGNHANAGYVKSSGVTSIATGTGLTGGPITSTGTMSIAAATLGKIESGSTAFGWGNHANAGYAKPADITSAVSALVTASGSKWSTDTDRYVATASFASTGSNGANGVKMTLTRRGSDTGTVVATIPVASTSAAGVMTGAMVTKLNGIATGATANTGTVTNVTATGGTGITASVATGTTTPAISISSAQAHIHSNKAVLDGITTAKTASWDAAKPGTVTSVTLTTSSNYVVVDNVAAITTSGTRKIDLTAATKGKIESGSVAFGWGNHANAGYLKGVVPVANGGTGQTTSLAAINGFLTSLPSWAANPTDTTFLIRQDTGGSNTFGRVTFGTVWNYVNGKTITSASRAVSAASADSATVATGLGVAANTSASVAAAINAKWTYNEATIKAVKVTSASRADSAASATSAVKLVGTSGSVGIPVYVNAGVPTACQANIVSLPLSSSGATTGTLTLVPGKVHDCGTLTGNLTLALGSDNTYTHEAIYCCIFNMGSTLRTITLPAGVSVMQNSVDLDTTDVYYEINIMNNVAVIARTSAS